MIKQHAGLVGLVPWLPWPLSHWSWWTKPVRAERLALLRIGVALCLLMDIGVNYAPETLTYFAKDGLGGSEVHDWRFAAPRWSWSLLRGVGDPTIRFLSLAVCLAVTCWILGTSLTGVLMARRDPPKDDQTGMARWIWTVSFTLYTLGLWSEVLSAGTLDPLVWYVPLTGFVLACLLFGIDFIRRIRDANHRILWRPLAASLLAPLGLALIGTVSWYWHESAEGPQLDFDKAAWWFRLLQPWQNDSTLLIAAMCLWIASAFLLLLGCATRFSAVLTWMISMSFANLNPHLDNAGDTIRQILLFYLMLCQCGAVWSMDALLARKVNRAEGERKSAHMLVHPWPIRLLFIQLVLMYFLNGLYKLSGSAWFEGTSLHYVLGDITLARFSAAMLPLPYELTQVMTWTVLVWELSFPLMVLWKWPRRIALLFGVMFHLGIFATMELASFAPYALCLYLPLLPWGGERPPKASEAQH